MDCLLKVDGITKKMNGGFLLKPVSFEVEPGFIVGLLGVNGSGKTTLIRTMLNMYAKDGGEVFVDGVSMAEHEREAKDLIGFVLDENVFEEDISVLDNARAFGSYYKYFDEELFLEYCKRFGVSAKKKVKELSKGQSVRFQLAFALSHDAKLFIMDEPAAGLDPLFRKEMIGYMQELVENGTRSVLMSTHITEDLEPVGDYIALMREGELLLYLSMEELKDRYAIVYGSEEEIDTLHGDVIYRQHEEFRHLAFVRRNPEFPMKGLEMSVPKLDEIMYYLEKGGYAYV